MKSSKIQNRKLRIGLDGRLYRSSTGGIGRYSQELIKHLLTIDRETTYVLFLTPADAIECQLEANNLQKIITPIKHFSLAEQFQLPGLLASQKLDLVHFLNFNHPLFYNGRFVTTIHDLTMNFFPVGRQRSPLRRYAYITVMNHAAKASAAVIVPTETVKKDVLKYLGAKSQKIHPIYEGVEIPQSVNTKTKKHYLASLGITKPYLLFVSQWRPHKGIGVLLKAFSLIKKDHDIQLVITGKPNPQFPEISATVEASPHRNDIVTPGFVPDSVLDALYAGAALFVFPSWYEGFGLPPLEAMARGVPVASSNASVMPEVLGSAAVYFDPKDANQMAKILIKALDNTDELQELRRQGLKQAARYSWATMATETLALYQKVIQEL